jgi:hypothetical protein
MIYAIITAHTDAFIVQCMSLERTAIHSMCLMITKIGTMMNITSTMMNMKDSATSIMKRKRTQKLLIISLLATPRMNPHMSHYFHI